MPLLAVNTWCVAISHEAHLVAAGSNTGDVRSRRRRPVSLARPASLTRARPTSLTLAPFPFEQVHLFRIKEGESDEKIPTLSTQGAFISSIAFVCLMQSPPAGLRRRAATPLTPVFSTEREKPAAGDCRVGRQNLHF